MTNKVLDPRIDEHKIIHRVERLERVQADMRVEIAEVKSGQKELENTVMKDGQHTRELLNKVIDFLTENKTAQENNKTEIKLKSLDVKQQVIVGVVGAVFGGGTVATILSLFL